MNDHNEKEDRVEPRERTPSTSELAATISLLSPWDLRESRD